jgi:hypothetical protein
MHILDAWRHLKDVCDEHVLDFDGTFDTDLQNGWDTTTFSNERKQRLTVIKREATLVPQCTGDSSCAPVNGAGQQVCEPGLTWQRCSWSRKFEVHWRKDEEERSARWIGASTPGLGAGKVSRPATVPLPLAP